MDAHQHFWRYTEEEFGWIDDTMAAIRRDFLPADLAPLLHQTQVDATIAVQARQSLDETEWLLDLADRHEWIAGVVGWIPLAGPAAQIALHSLSANEKLKGVRHVLQSEADGYMDREDFNAGLGLLEGYGMTYDVLVLERHLPAAMRLIDRHPRQSFVIDHVAKPRIAAAEMEPWRARIRELARRPHVVCKLSGMVTEAKFHSWTIEDLRPYFETVLEAFGPERILFGSDWPVCTVAATYAQWIEGVETLVAELSAEEQQLIFGINAANVYQLEQNQHNCTQRLEFQSGFFVKKNPT